MTETRFLQLTEHNDAKGETWHQRLQIDGNEAELDKLRSLLVEAEAAFEDGPEDFPDVLGEIEPESVVNIPVQHGEDDYAAHGKALGEFVCPDTLGDDEADVAYQGGIRKLFAVASS